MEHDTQIVVRMPVATASRVKEYASKLSKELGVRVSVAEATRKLLSSALDAADGERFVR